MVFPPGTYAVWSGQFEYLERAKAKLKIVVPATLLLIFGLLYVNFGRIVETLIVMAVTALRAGRRPVAGVVDGLQHERLPWRWASSPWPGWRQRPAW